MFDKANLVLVGANGASGYWWDLPGWHWSMGLHGVIWLALIVLVILTAFVLIRSSNRGFVRAGSPAKAVLDTRYASGEIDRGEYLERKRDLS